MTEQVAKLNELACKLRRLVRVCAHGDRDDCLTLRIQPVLIPRGYDERH